MRRGLLRRGVRRQHCGYCGGLFAVEVPAKRQLPALDRLVDPRRRHHLALNDDRDPPTDMRRGERREAPAPRLAQGNVDDGHADVLVYVGARIRHLRK